MSDKVNIYEAKTRLSQLVDRAAKGEEIVIARGGRPIARLVALSAPAAKRKPGRLRGRVRVRRNFDAPLPEELFESRHE
jgi:prevent-host-death family protein